MSMDYLVERFFSPKKSNHFIMATIRAILLSSNHIWHNGWNVSFVCFWSGLSKFFVIDTFLTHTSTKNTVM